MKLAALVLVGLFACGGTEIESTPSNQNQAAMSCACDDAGCDTEQAHQACDSVYSECVGSMDCGGNPFDNCHECALLFSDCYNCARNGVDAVSNGTCVGPERFFSCE